MKNQNQVHLQTTSISQIPQAKCPLTEMEDAKNQSNALLVLLEQSMNYQHETGAWTEEFGDLMFCGIGQLVIATTHRLDRAVQALFDEQQTERGLRKN